MIQQNIFIFILGFATLSTALVAGLVFTFTVVIMPGIGRLDDRNFVRAFQVMDGVIQEGKAVFGLVWIGSILSLLAVSILGFGQLDGVPKWLLLAANLLYIVGVQLPTFMINVPLNNRLQAIDVTAASEEEIDRARHGFEGRWNRSNRLRAYASMPIAAILIVIIYLM